MSFLAGDDAILKYSKFSKKIKKLLSAEFDSQPVYEETCIITTVKTFGNEVVTKFTDNEIPKENTHYSYTAICVDSVLK